MTSLAIVVGLWVVVGLAAAVSALRRRANDTKRIERFQRALWINEERTERDDQTESEPSVVHRAPASGVTILGPRAQARGASQPVMPSRGTASGEGGPTAEGGPAGAPAAGAPAAGAPAAERPGPTPALAERQRSAEAEPFPRARIPEGTRRHFGGAGRSRPRLAHLGRVAGEGSVELPAAAQLEAEAAQRAREAVASDAGPDTNEPDAPGASGTTGGSDAPRTPPAPPAPSADQSDERSTTAEDGAEEPAGVHAAAMLEEPVGPGHEPGHREPPLVGTVPWLPDAISDARALGWKGGLQARVQRSARAPYASHRHRPRRLALLGAIATVVVVAVGASVALSETSGGSTLAAPRQGRSDSTGRSRASKATGTPGAHSDVPTTTTTTTPPKPSVVQPVSSDAVQASYVTPSAPFDLTLSTSGPCWIDLVNRASGAVLYTGTMTAGQSKSFSGLDQIYLRAGRMKNLQISIDGIPVDSPNNGPGAYDLIFQVPTGSSPSAASGSSGTPA